jgi:mitogen-activated protein kinase 7
MAELHGRKVFKVFNQDFIVDQRYNVTKELGQGAYGIVWCVCLRPPAFEPQC